MTDPTDPIPPPTPADPTPPPTPTRDGATRR